MTDARAVRAQQRRHREAADWVFRNKEAIRTEQDDKAFNSWLNQDPENKRAYDIAEQLLGDAHTAIKSDPKLRAFKTKVSTLTKPVTGTLLSLALAGAIFILLDGPLYLEADLMSGTYNMPVVTLDDGSTLQLNASSAVAYNYDSQRRTIRLLKGQAFFQVAKDSERPFVVEAGNAQITALGTAFDVRLGTEDTDVTVTESTVLFQTSERPEWSTRVTEGQQIMLNRNTGEAEVHHVDDMTALAWRRGQLAVDNAPLSRVIEEINRHFSGRIMLMGNDISNRRVSGTIKVTDTDDALSFLAQALKVKITRMGPLIVISDG